MAVAKRGVHKMKKPFVSGIVILFVGLIIGYFFGTSSNSNNSGLPAPAGCSAKLEKCSAQIENAKKFFPTVNDMRSLSGTVKKISGNIITLESAPSPNPFEEIPATRQITVTSNTKILKTEPKSAEQFDKEIAELKKSMSQQSDSQAAAIIAPTPFIEKELKVTDLKVGDMISVTASENIKTLAKFDAVQITMQGAAVPMPTGSSVPSSSPAPILPTPSPSGTPAPIAP